MNINQYTWTMDTQWIFHKSKKLPYLHPMFKKNPPRRCCFLISTLHPMFKTNPRKSFSWYVASSTLSVSTTCIKFNPIYRSSINFFGSSEWNLKDLSSRTLISPKLHYFLSSPSLFPNMVSNTFTTHRDRHR